MRNAPLMFKVREALEMRDVYLTAIIPVLGVVKVRISRYTETHVAGLGGKV